ISPSQSCQAASEVTTESIDSSLRSTCECTAMGLIKADTPRVRATLVMFGPYAFPSAMPGLPCEAASADTHSTGAEATAPTSTKPTSGGGMPKWRAVEADPSTKRSALQTRSASPKITAMKASVIQDKNSLKAESYRVLWRPFRLSQAAMV